MLPFCPTLALESNIGTATLLAVGIFVVGVALMWAIIRNMPVRTRTG